MNANDNNPNTAPFKLISIYVRVGCCGNAVKRSFGSSNNQVFEIDRAYKSLLKELVVDNGIYILRSCNEDKETYPDINPRNLKIQGVAVCVMHRLKKRR